MAVVVSYQMALAKLADRIVCWNTARLWSRVAMLGDFAIVGTAFPTVIFGGMREDKTVKDEAIRKAKLQPILTRQGLKTFCQPNSTYQSFVFQEVKLIC